MPLSIFQIPLKSKIIQAEFHPRNSSIIILYSDGELQSVSHEGKENWSYRFDCEPITFRINASGDLIALLGKGKLFFYNLLTLKSSCTDVDEKIQLMEFYKDTVLLGGYQKDILLMRQNGTVLKNIEFKSLIRQFKPAPLTGNLIIYDQDSKLICADMDGKTVWHVEHLVIHKEIVISQNGYIGYFILNPNDLLQFNVNGESFFEVCDERTLKEISISMDGSSLLALDSENRLVMFDKEANTLWGYSFEHGIKKIKLSQKGDFFFTVDDDNILSCYTAGPTDKSREDFLEMSDNNRILEKEVLWSIRPGGFNQAAGLSELTVSRDGHLFGLVGLDGCIYFYDEQGKTKFQTSFTSTVKNIRISDNSEYGYIYGGNEIIIVDFHSDKKKYILFEKTLIGNPAVNFYLKKIFTISKEKELLIYDFDGRLVNTLPLNKEYQKAISCEGHEMTLISEEEITGLSAEGKIIFTYTLESKIEVIFYSEPMLICSGKGGIIKIDFSTLKGKRKKLAGNGEDSRIVSLNPLFIVTGDKKLHHLDQDLSVISTYPVESMDSHFFLDEGRLFEIIRRGNGFYCYNDKKEMLWRYSSEDRIVESELINNGMVFTTEQFVQYIEIKKAGELKKDFSQFLEI